MASKHGGLSKDDKSFIRKMNERLFQTGEGKNLHKEDLQNPSLRVAMQQTGAHKLSKFKYNQLLEMGQKKNYARMEQMAV